MKEEVVQAAAAMHLKALPNPAQDELESLFREHHEHVFRTAYRITGSASDAEDVLQTVFLRLLRRQEETPIIRDNPGGYLMRAGVNASLDLMRSRTRARSVALEDMQTDLMESPRQSPEAQQEDRELRKVVQKAIAQLGQRSAEIFVLRYFEGYDNREIGEMLGTSALVIGVSLHRTRGRLRKDIGEFLEKYHEA
jgi:RNA polymerase sigma-70 factor (ECF subfamily)